MGLTKGEAAKLYVEYYRIWNMIPDGTHTLHPSCDCRELMSGLLLYAEPEIYEIFDELDDKKNEEFTPPAWPVPRQEVEILGQPPEKGLDETL